MNTRKFIIDIPINMYLTMLIFYRCYFMLYVIVLFVNIESRNRVDKYRQSDRCTLVRMLRIYIRNKNEDRRSGLNNFKGFKSA